ncbi:MAG: thermonuclease family protein [Terrimesophilobacter sp.]
MKRLSAILLVTVALAIAIAVLVANLHVPTNTPHSAPTNASIPTRSASDYPPLVATISRPAGATLSHIAYVYDGDTLYLQPDGTTARADEITVRLIGIDTPELRPEVQCYAIKARDYVRNMLPKGTAVWIMADKAKLDKYGRSLLYVWKKDGTSVNLDLVEKGYATALNIPPSNTYWRQFASAESVAKNARVGRWGSC